MVSGFLISPKDHERIFSGEARAIRIWSKLGAAWTGLKMFRTSWFIGYPVRQNFRARWRGADGPLPSRKTSVGRRAASAVFQLHVQAQRTHLLDQHVEAFRNAGLEGVVAADDRLVDLGPAGDVVRLHRQHFLQGVGGAVGFQRPDLHFPEALTAELRLAAQRLLSDERVRADRTGVDLVVHQVVQLQHVDVADGDRALELLAGLAVVEVRLTGAGEARLFQQVLDVVDVGAVEHR